MHLCFLIILAILSGCATGKQSPGSHIDGSIVVDSIKRTYHLYIPAAYDGNPTPLLIVLHGGGGTGKQIEEETTLGGFDKLAEKENFIVAYPDAVEKHWNDGRNDPYSYSAQHNINDVKFISRLIDHLQSKYRIDRTRVYVTGMSNGGMMTFRLGCELSNKISAIATVAASMPENLYKTCSPENYISVLIIHGTDDPIVPWNGGDVVVFGKKHGKVVSIPETVNFWVTHNNCTPVEKSYLPDRDPNDGTRVWVEKYANEKNNVKVVLYKVEGGGHTWPDGSSSFPRITGNITHDINACEVIWNFFKESVK